jgi:hypothetical protein
VEPVEALVVVEADKSGHGALCAVYEQGKVGMNVERKLLTGVALDPVYRLARGHEHLR